MTHRRTFSWWWWRHWWTDQKEVFFSFYSFFVFLGTFVMQATATDADDPTYGNSARIVYSILHGQPYFSVEPKTGRWRAVQDPRRRKTMRGGADTSITPPKRTSQSNNVLFGTCVHSLKQTNLTSKNKQTESCWKLCPIKWHHSMTVFQQWSNQRAEEQICFSGS